MNDILEMLNNFAQNHTWFIMVLTVLLSIHTVMKAVRDAIDKTPLTDDNWFEKTVTIMGKVIPYLLSGIRPKQNP